MCNRNTPNKSTGVQCDRYKVMCLVYELENTWLMNEKADRCVSSRCCQLVCTETDNLTNSADRELCNITLKYISNTDNDIDFDISNGCNNTCIGYKWLTHIRVASTSLLITEEYVSWNCSSRYDENTFYNPLGARRTLPSNFRLIHKF